MKGNDKVNLSGRSMKAGKFLIVWSGMTTEAAHRELRELDADGWIGIIELPMRKR